VFGLDPGSFEEAGHVRSRDQICLEMVAVTWLPGQISLSRDLATVKIEMIGHVWSRSWTCLVLLTRTQQWTRISPEN
jgi:hypothetical protein